VLFADDTGDVKKGTATAGVHRDGSTAATPLTRSPLATLVKVAGLRWTIKENFQADKGCFFQVGSGAVRDTRSLN
jgi:hypothetical protein